MKIKTRKEFSSVPEGTEGIAEPDGVLWKITWDLPKRYFGLKPKPLVDWFDKSEFAQYLTVVEQ